MTTVDALKGLLSPVFSTYTGRVLFAYLFGSAARQDFTPLSDIDIAAFLSPGTRESYIETRLSLHADLCRTLHRDDVDLVILNTASNIILLDEIVRYGVLLLDRDPDLREEFELKVLHRALDFREQRFAVMGL